MIYVNVSEGLIGRFLVLFKDKNINFKKVDDSLLELDLSYQEGIDFINNNSYLKKYVYRIYYIDNKVEDIDELLPYLKNKDIRVMIHPSFKQKNILKYLASNNVNLTPTNYSDVLFIVDLEDTEYIEFGLLSSLEVYIKNNDENHVSRSYYKLKEIILREEIDLQNKNILDIGSDPGGRCEFAKNYAKKIICVDPEELKIKDSNIVHFKDHLENVISKINKEDYDIIILDINKDPELLINDIFKLKYKNKTLIFILKFNKRGHTYISRRINEIKEQFSNKCISIKDYWLFTNTTSERTLVCKFK